MLVIGHRGAKGTKPDNTLESLKAGMHDGADIIECDVRLTRDGVPVLFHDATLMKFKKLDLPGNATLQELQDYSKNSAPIVTLKEALELCFGKVLLNIELKSQGSGKKCLEILEKDFIKNRDDWDKIFFSSFLPSELQAVRKLNKHVSLSLLHFTNPFIFIAYQKKLNLSAVGFHHLHLNTFAQQIAEQTDLFTYVYTVNRPGLALELEKKGIGGIVTDFPDKMVSALE